MKYNIEQQLKEVNKIITYWQNKEEYDEYQRNKDYAKYNREMYESIRETLLSVKEKV